MNREQRKYFTDRLDNELNKALSELNARSEKKIKQLPNKCEAHGQASSAQGCVRRHGGVFG